MSDLNSNSNNANITDKLPIANVSPNTTTDFVDFSVKSTIPSKSHYELSKTTIADRLNAVILGVGTERYEESLTDFISEIKKDRFTVFQLELSGNAIAQEQSSLEIQERIQMARFEYCDLSNESSTAKLMTPLILPPLTIAKAKKQIDYRSNHKYLELLEHLGEDMVKISNWLGLIYEQKEKAKIKNIELSPFSFLRVEETYKTRSQGKTGVVHQTAKLGFLIKSEALDDKIITEKYSIRLDVGKFVSSSYKS